jgi:hypothetical protein
MQAQTAELRPSEHGAAMTNFLHPNDSIGFLVLRTILEPFEC